MNLIAKMTKVAGNKATEDDLLRFLEKDVKALEDKFYREINNKSLSMYKPTLRGIEEAFNSMSDLYWDLKNRLGKD